MYFARTDTPHTMEGLDESTGPGTPGWPFAVPLCELQSGYPSFDDWVSRPGHSEGKEGKRDKGRRASSQSASTSPAPQSHRGLGQNKTSLCDQTAPTPASTLPKQQPALPHLSPTSCPPLQTCSECLFLQSHSVVPLVSPLPLCLSFSPQRLHSSLGPFFGPPSPPPLLQATT